MDPCSKFIVTHGPTFCNIGYQEAFHWLATTLPLCSTSRLTAKMDSVYVPLTNFIASSSAYVPSVLDVNVQLNAFLQMGGRSYDTENKNLEVSIINLAGLQRRYIAHLHRL